MAVVALFEGVYKVDGKLATRNLVHGARVYGEELVHVAGVEYRLWNPYRSKLAAAILNGLQNMEIGTGCDVLYLGAATGTTSSHVSDIVGREGSVYCVESSERSMRDLIDVCEKRENMFPILQDARAIEGYEKDVGKVDILYQDVSARDQADIFIRNSELLRNEGFAYVAIKSQSIDVARNPREVFKEFLDKVSRKLKPVETIKIEPYDRMHLFAVFQKR